MSSLKTSGVVVTCPVDVNGTSYFNQSLYSVNILSSTWYFRGYYQLNRTEGGSFNHGIILCFHSQLNLLPTYTTSTTSTQYICPDSCKPIMMYFLIPVFGVLLIAAVMVLAGLLLDQRHPWPAFSRCYT